MQDREQYSIEKTRALLGGIARHSTHEQASIVDPARQAIPGKPVGKFQSHYIAAFVTGERLGFRRSYGTTPCADRGLIARATLNTLVRCMRPACLSCFSGAHLVHSGQMTTRFIVQPCVKKPECTPARRQAEAEKRGSCYESARSLTFCGIYFAQV